MRSIVLTTAWGIYCACSWTWCIGMYLPIILLDDFGWPGVLVFAVPNLAGCTLFGYVLSRRRPEHAHASVGVAPNAVNRIPTPAQGTGKHSLPVAPAPRSAALVERHRTAMRWFSAVTVAYHLFFAAFAVRVLVPRYAGVDLPAGAGVLAPLALLGAGLLLSLLRDRAWLVTAAVVYAISIATLSSLGLDPLERLPLAGAGTPTQLGFLAPVIAIGFLLCPYLDRTFHRAVQHTPSRHAFAVFGATFAVMLLLTCVYWTPPIRSLLPLLAGHVIAQAVFTVGAHLRELHGGFDRSWRPSTIAWIGLPLLAVPLAFAGDAGAGRDMYVRFLVFYGLLFPAYVLLFMGPFAWPDRPGSKRRGLAVFAAAVLVLLPVYELGFLHGRAWLLAIPVVAALAWIAVSRLVQGASSPVVHNM